MPWREVCSVDERMRLMAALAAQEDSVSELCEDFGISRKTAYKWWARYQQYGFEGLLERSHSPKVVPWAITGVQAEAIIGLRRAHTSWGPKKLRAWLMQRAPEQEWPAPSTIGELLRREQLSQPRKRRRHARPTARPISTQHMCYLSCRSKVLPIIPVAQWGTSLLTPHPDASFRDLCHRSVQRISQAICCSRSVLQCRSTYCFDQNPD
jgi:transposase-like protein